ncbi:protein US34 [Panine betaherpesvirus 2]|uniref:Protein US34 n=1 Tax=Panine betaherpesvirus 2 TaxID=188763 RepID=Q8QRS7_9BETA|nr:protein US34 [Panine betaherpesvirus 2]AAM00811.1 protein US34 [Panine betaherpesvirus 2]
MNIEKLVNLLGLLCWIAAQTVSRIAPHARGLSPDQLHGLYRGLHLELLEPARPQAANRSVRDRGGPATCQEEKDRGGSFPRFSGFRARRVPSHGSQPRGSDTLPALRFQLPERVLLCLNRGCHGLYAVVERPRLVGVPVSNSTVLPVLWLKPGATWENGTAPIRGPEER